MRAIKLLFFFGLAVYFLLVVIARTPATWGAWVAQQAVPGLSFSGVTGTVWQGRAAGTVLQVAGQTLDFGALRWELHKMPLVLANACLDVQSQNVNGNVCHSAGGTTRVEQLLVDQLPASLLNDNVGVLLGGMANATVSRAVISRDRISALDGNLVWQGARVNYGDGWMPLGGFGANLADNGAGGLRASISDLEGPFAVELQAEYQLGNGEPQVEGTVTPRANAPQQLVNGLSVLAEPLDNGAFRLTWPLGG